MKHESLFRYNFRFAHFSYSLHVFNVQTRQLDMQLGLLSNRSMSPQVSSRIDPSVLPLHSHFNTNGVGDQIDKMSSMVASILAAKPHLI